ncbi:tyrosine-protein phosphatase [Actinokineospora globicatena]|uniref:Protein-tyrosine-phosphatase n=1 Tax=Actinokineospora globicatena TaxID=103729 RepID=A0A9W6QJZ0_9PSEU|nr:tyrosine-protein phosphatase [Actinokineospora globicatena]GLW89548.1 protein-tyrosine-phosphatase [Actinokineospora globicatena]
MELVGERHLDWDGSCNARDLGGLGKVKRGAVVRMEAPNGLTAAGWAAAWDYGVRTVVDLRNSDEYGTDGAERPAGITTVRAPLDPVGTPFYEHWHKIDYLASPLYYAPLLAEHPEVVIGAVRAVANAAPGGVVFHCAAGKDRTGLLALVLLTLAAATPDEIITDYHLTFTRRRHLYTAPEGYDELAYLTEVLTRHNTTAETLLAATITALPMPTYLLDNGLTEAELTALHTRLTG